MYFTINSIADINYSVATCLKEIDQEKGKEVLFAELLETYNYWGDLAELGEVHDEYPQIAVENLLESAGYSWDEWFTWIT